jgi:hypothetical protein
MSEHRNPADAVGLAALEAEAAALHAAVTAGDESAIRRVTMLGRVAPSPSSYTLGDAKAAIAAEYGFESWHHLRTEVGTTMVRANDLHRWFGAHLNNQAWDVISEGPVPEETPETEKEAFLYSAFASAWHWRQIGDAANAARGEHLISRVATCVGDTVTALRHARRCLELVDRHPEVMAEWDAAFAHEALARALAAAGDRDAAISHLEVARTLTAGIEDEGDRAVLESEFNTEPWFGLQSS